MAKPLTQKPPTSSVANMLTPGIGASLLARAQPHTESQPIAPRLVETPMKPTRLPLGLKVEAADRKAQFLLTKSAEEVMEELASIYGNACGMKPNRSELLRAILKAMGHAMDELKREAVHVGSLKRPKKEKGSEGLRELMEDRIAKAIVAGMRASDLPSEETD
jgi:hypothetical protein